MYGNVPLNQTLDSSWVWGEKVKGKPWGPCFIAMDVYNHSQSMKVGLKCRRTKEPRGSIIYNCMCIIYIYIIYNSSRKPFEHNVSGVLTNRMSWGRGLKEPVSQSDARGRPVFSLFDNHNFQSLYTICLFNSSPWKIHPFLRTVNHLFLWAIYTMAMLVITRGCHRQRHPKIPITNGDIAVISTCWFQRISSDKGWHTVLNGLV